MTRTDERPLIYDLYENPVSGAEIEARSFAAIDAEAESYHLSPAQWEVVRRLIHTTADFALAELTCFSDDAFTAATKALKSGASIYADSNMIRSGLSVARLQQVNPSYLRDDIFCHVADDDVADKAKQEGLPRSLFAVQKAKEMLHDSIVLIGNAPVALLEINRLAIEEGIRPALVIGMPVGFIHVLESKEELLKTGLPHVVLSGRRGGSPLAVACLHAMCSVACEQN